MEEDKGLVAREWLYTKVTFIMVFVEKYEI